MLLVEFALNDIILTMVYIHIYLYIVHASQMLKSSLFICKNEHL